ncbi:MAG: pilus assembly protein TadG-related protein [Rhodoferax sp.]
MNSRRRRTATAAAGRRYQRGQALILGIFVLVAGLVSLYFLFNTGQLVREKTKLVNTADTVAYSAAIMNARALNFNSYINRAMVANTVTIAQTVSLASWVRYVNNLSMWGWTGAGQTHKYPLYAPGYYAAQTSAGYLDGAFIQGDVLKHLVNTSDAAIRALHAAQGLVHAGIGGAQAQVMNQVAQANYNNDGTVTVESVRTGAPEFQGFVKKYSGNDRGRLASLAKLAAYRDEFVPKRSWSMVALINNCPQAAVVGRRDWIERRGGTELLGFDEWKAMDTMSEKVWVPRSKWDAFCGGLTDTPQAWGAQAAADNPSFDFNPNHYDSAPAANPGAAGLAVATSGEWGYSGIPSYFDLGPSHLPLEDPRITLAVKVKRTIAQTLTSEARSEIKKTDRLNNFQATPAGGEELVAVSAAEVFFERPDLDGSCMTGAQHRKNCYGQDSLSKGKEIGSLFNPYWQVRLVQSNAAILHAQTAQGVVLP